MTCLYEYEQKNTKYYFSLSDYKENNNDK